MVFAYLVLLVFSVFIVLLLIKIRQLTLGKSKAEQESRQIEVKRTDDLELKTEAGVSYLVKTDDTTILMDVGYNGNKEHPSPLIHNMRSLNIEAADIDMLFISHPHLDHLGGMKEQRQRLFSLSQGTVELRNIPVYAPTRVSPSHWNPEPEQITIIREPKGL